MRAKSRVPENPCLLRKDGGSATQVRAFPPLACNLRILVVRFRFRVCYCLLVVGAREADRLAELALRGVCGERGRVAGDSYDAGLWLSFADPGRYGSVSWTGCLSGTQQLPCPRVPELAALYPGLWASGQGAVPCA